MHRLRSLLSSSSPSPSKASRPHLDLPPAAAADDLPSSTHPPSSPSASITALSMRHQWALLSRPPSHKPPASSSSSSSSSSSPSPLSPATLHVADSLLLHHPPTHPPTHSKRLFAFGLPRSPLSSPKRKPTHPPTSPLPPLTPSPKLSTLSSPPPSTTHPLTSSRRAKPMSIRVDPRSTEDPHHSFLHPPSSPSLTGLLLNHPPSSSSPCLSGGGGGGGGVGG